MYRCEMRPLSQTLLLMAILLLCSIAAAPSKGDYVLEDPNSLTAGQEWYLITFDANGVPTRKEGWGYGSGWYYYPLTKTYRQWFYRGPFDATHDGCMTISAAIVSANPAKLASAELDVIWSTQAWSARGAGRPPLPDDVSSAATESQYVASDVFQSVPPSFFATVEPARDYTILGCSPEWVGIDVKGKNVEMLRFVAPICAGVIATGACCNPSTGDCFLTDASHCSSPYTWRGANSTCDSCSGLSGGTLDFGNAPDSYATLLKSDGARHIISSGVLLGRLIYGTPDGQPNTTPADKDGVVFTSPLTPGEQTTLTVTASVQGYLNAWVDFARDGTFSGAGKQIFTDMLLLAGVNHLTFNVPATAKLGQTWARFRFNRRGLLSWKGLAEDGEVEDYKVSIAGAYDPQASSNRGAAKWFQTPQAAAASTPFVFKAWGEPSNSDLGQVLADDWQCQDSRPVTGFQWWGTFTGWTESRMPSQTPSAFQIAIWTNSPAVSGKNSFAHPNTLVWQANCTGWTWSVAGQADDPRNVNSNETCFEFTCLLSQDQWFYQDPGNGTATYWLSIAAVYDTAPLAHPWSWMTESSSAGNGAVKMTALTSADGSTGWPPRLASVWSAGTQMKDNQAALQNLAFNVLTNDGQTASDLNLAPVYRFWSSSMKTHFYTISESEKEKLVKLFSDLWLYEGIAFYAYPPGSQPISAKPVYRFRSATDGHHFYTISEGEKSKLIDRLPNQWIYEGIVWYAYD